MELSRASVLEIRKAFNSRLKGLHECRFLLRRNLPLGLGRRQQLCEPFLKSLFGVSRIVENLQEGFPADDFVQMRSAGVVDKEMGLICGAQQIMPHAQGFLV